MPDWSRTPRLSSLSLLLPSLSPIPFLTPMRRLFGGSRKQSKQLPAVGVDDPPNTPKTPQTIQTTTGTKPGQNLTVDTRPLSLVQIRFSPHRGGTSQSTSSDASSSVRTPSDYEPLEDIQNKKSWVSWMAPAKRRKQSPERNRRTAVSGVFPKPNARLLPAPAAVDGDTTSDEDDASNTSWSDLAGGDGLFPSPSATTLRPALIQQRPRPPQELSRAIANLRAITLNSLQSASHTTSPLVQSQSSPQFPRSSNLVNRFPPLPLMCVEVHKKRLLKRLESRKLERLEQLSILPFSTRAHTRNKAIRSLSTSEETMAVSKAVGGGWSRGMKQWALRPCFEERVVVWTVDATDHLVRALVSRSSLLGVAELEFSEGAEALAGLHRQNELPPPPSGKQISYFTLYLLTVGCLDIYVPAANCRLPPPLVVPRKSPLLHFASGTRIDLPNDKLMGASRASMLDLTLLEGVSGDEDDLPLGVVLYRRQGSHAQHRTQLGEAQRLAHKPREEAKQREAEAKAKAKQEELQRRKFAEQIAAARERREQVRTGKPARDPWLEGVDSGAVPPVKTRKPTEASPTMTKDSTPRRQTLPANSTPPRVELPPSMGMPLTAPLTVPYACGPMPFVDPLQIAAFEQGMRVWAYNESANGSLARPRFLGSSGSTGSLTPPRFPNSRPLSFAPSTEELNTRLTRPRSHVSPPEDVGLRSGREPSTSQSRTRLDGEGPRSSNTLPRSSSARPDLNSGSKAVVKAGHNYPPPTSSWLAQPPATFPSDQSTEVAHSPSRPHTRSMPNRHIRSGQRRMTVTDGFRTKGENDRPAPSLASTLTPKEGKRTLTSYGSVWSIRDKLQSRTIVS